MQPTNGQLTESIEASEIANENAADNETLNGLKNDHSSDEPDDQVKEFLEKAKKFKEYVDSETEFFRTYYDEVIQDLEYKNPDLASLIQNKKHLFKSISDLIGNYKVKFDESYGRWKKQVVDYGEIYFNNDKDRLHLSMCSSRFTNDDHNTLTPFGSSLVVYGELISHHKISVLDALESQLPNENLTFSNGQEGLITAQMILLLMYDRFIDFCSGWDEANQKANLKDDWRCPPLVQLSYSNTGAWAADRETPTIIHVNKATATKLPKGPDSSDFEEAFIERLAAYAACPHEFAHDIMDGFKDDKLVESIQKSVVEAIEAKGDSEKITERKIQLWSSWMHELVADAFGDGVLHKVALTGLKQVLLKRLDQRAEPVDLIIKNFDWDNDRRPYDEHPNSFIRVLLSIEFIYQIHKDSDQAHWDDWKNKEWEEWLNVEEVVDKIEMNGSGDDLTFVFKDQKNRDDGDLEYFEIKKSEIEEMVGLILTAPIDWFPNGFFNFKDLIAHITQDSDIRLLLDKFESMIRTDLKNYLN